MRKYLNDNISLKINIIATKRLQNDLPGNDLVTEKGGGKMS